MCPKNHSKLITGLEIDKIREDFPILRTRVRGNPLVYLDNAATAQKPLSVIRAIEKYYREQNANVHRGVHYLSEIATDAYEGAREVVKTFLNARSSSEIIFVRGATEAINLVASSFGTAFIREGDEIIISGMEHHSNIVPWHLLKERTGCKLRIIPFSDEGELLIDEYKKMFSSRTRLVSVVHVSNTLGTINPIKEMIDIAHENGVPFLVDGAQAVPHSRIDVQELDCDFYVFSGHKVFGPTGIGVLYGKESLLDRMPPYQGGGDMIRSVTLERTIFNDLPHKFEAGTPHIAGAVGLKEALRYVEKIGYDFIESHERELLEYATEELRKLPDLKIIGTADHKTAVISFVIEGIHPHDVGTVLDNYGVAIRTGHHCTQPIMERFGIPATARASFAFYNKLSEVDQLIRALKETYRLFKV